MSNKTLEFCKASEYRADMSESKNIKTKDRNRKYPQTRIFNYVYDVINVSPDNTKHEDAERTKNRLKDIVEPKNDNFYS